MSYLKYSYYLTFLLKIVSKQIGLLMLEWLYWIFQKYFIFFSSFFAAGDFKSAANVYTHAIHLTPKLAAYPLLIKFKQINTKNWHALLEK